MEGFTLSQKLKVCTSGAARRVHLIQTVHRLKIDYERPHKQIDLSANCFFGSDMCDDGFVEDKSQENDSGTCV